MLRAIKTYRWGGVLILAFSLTLATAVGAAPFHNADSSADWEVGLSEVLRVIQFYNSDAHHCDAGTEDGYAPGSGDVACDPHDADYSPQDWSISLSELLRVIQLYQGRVYGVDPAGEDGFNPLFDDEPPASVMEEFGSMKEFISEVPEELVPPTMLMGTLGALVDAESKFTSGDLCGAGDSLDTLLGETQRLREQLAGKTNRSLSEPKTVDARGQKIILIDAVGVAESLFAMGNALQYDMLADLATLPGVAPCPNQPRIGLEAAGEVTSQNSSGVGITFSFGAPRFWSEPRIGKEAIYSKFQIPGLGTNASGAGKPGIPTMQRVIAIPPDSQPVLEYSPGTARTIKIRLASSVPQPVDQPPLEGELEPPPLEFFEDPDYYEDPDIYEDDADWPPTPVVVIPLGKMRHLHLAQIIVFGGQYNPYSEELTLFDDMTVHVAFNSPVDKFLDEAATNPFESAPGLYVDPVLNKASVLEAGVIEGLTPILTGEEFMIMTHPDFNDAAITLRDWKRSKGIMTNVYTCGTGSGITGRETNQEIDDFIEDHYDSVFIKPSYILLLGDAEYIPPFYDMNIGTDWFYATKSGGLFSDIFPFFAVGRIPVDTLAQANTVVNKIVDYEQSPPGSPIGLDAFYNRVTLASQFQCCRTDVAQVGTAQRTFAEVSEFAHALLDGKGYSVERIYQETVSGSYWGDPTPRRYYDGTLINPAIGPSSGFSWNGTRQEVIDAFNEGRFLFLHRDHGWHSGWSHPPFDSSDVYYDLTNGEFLPVVFSINCSSGLFDNETAPGAEGTSTGGVYMAERLLREVDGGAVGVIGDTRVSPSWPNTALTRGLFDAIWPDAIPSYGGNTTIRRLGDILNHAKIYLITQIGVAGAGVDANDYAREMRLYHVLGDPTLEIWTKDPKALTLAPEIYILAYDPRLLLLELEYAVEDAVVTAYQYGPDGALVPLGRGQVSQGEVLLELVGTPDTGQPVLLTAAMPDAVSVMDSRMLPVAK